MMDQMMDGMMWSMWSMWLSWFLLVLVLVLAGAALSKYLFFSGEATGRDKD
jgi:hypothetical protein